jgi:hypothetical protein
MTSRPLAPSVPDLLLFGIAFALLLLPWTLGEIVMRSWND